MKTATGFKLIFLCLVAFGSFLIYSDFKKPQKSESSSMAKKPTFDQKAYEARMNKHLSEMYNKINDKKSELKLEAVKGQMLGPTQAPVAPPYSVLGEGENDQSQTQGTYSPDSPSEMIQTELYREQLQKIQDDKDKREYARQFIDYAYQQGYDVELNEDLEIIDLKPISRSPARQK